MPHIPAIVAKYLQDLRASYWFVPTLFVLGALVMAVIMVLLDRSELDVPLPQMLLDTQAEGARAVLSVIAQSVIGVAGVMFSMTMVAVSFASSNYGPRLISNFMRDRGNQITFGVMTGTFVYALFVLRAVQDPSVPDAAQIIEMHVPHLSMLVAMVFALISVGTMIYFIHHVPEMINIGNITAGLGRRLVKAIKAQECGDDAPHWSAENWTALKAESSGYLQTLDLAAIGDFAQENECRIAVRAVPGDFVTPRTQIFAVERTNADMTPLTSAYALGVERTEFQNLTFIVQQLVEIISRALSPGINDPYTAMDCYNWLKAGLIAAAEQDARDGQMLAEGRVFLPGRSFADILEAGLGKSRQYCAADRLCALHVAALLTELDRLYPQEVCRTALRGEAARLIEALPDDASFREEITHALLGLIR